MPRKIDDDFRRGFHHAARRRQRRRGFGFKQSRGLRLYQDRPGGSYFVRGTIGGLRIRKSLKTNDRGEAQILLIQKQAEVSAERVGVALGILEPTKTRRTYYEATNTYLAAERRSKDTQDLANKLASHIGPVPCESVNQELLQQIAGKMLRPGYKPATFKRQILSPVSAVLAFANAMWGAAQGCPLQKFRSARNPLIAKEVLWPDEVRQLVALALKEGDEELATVISIGICEGPRRTELCNLRWAEVDFQAKRLIVDECKGALFDRRTRIIGNPRACTLAVLQRWQQATARPSEFVFPNEAGAQRTPEQFGLRMNTRLRHLAKKLEMRKHVHLHLFRHTAASWDYAVTKDLERVKSRMDWRTIAMAHRYVHLLPEGFEADVKAFWEGKLPPGDW